MRTVVPPPPRRSLRRAGHHRRHPPAGWKAMSTCDRAAEAASRVWSRTTCSTIAPSTRFSAWTRIVTVARSSGGISSAVADAVTSGVPNTASPREGSRSTHWPSRSSWTHVWRSDFSVSAVSGSPGIAAIESPRASDNSAKSRRARGTIVWASDASIESNAVGPSSGDSGVWRLRSTRRSAVAASRSGERESRREAHGAQQRTEQLGPVGCAAGLSGERPLRAPQDAAIRVEPDAVANEVERAFRVALERRGERGDVPALRGDRIEDASSAGRVARAGRMSLPAPSARRTRRRSRGRRPMGGRSRRAMRAPSSTDPGRRRCRAATAPRPRGRRRPPSATAVGAVDPALRSRCHLRLALRSRHVRACLTVSRCRPRRGSARPAHQG